MLGAWQIAQADRTAGDLATRTVQGLHSRLVLIPADAVAVRAMLGKELPPHPRVALIDEVWRVGAWQSANYYAFGTVFAGPLKAFTVVHRDRWAAPAGGEGPTVLSEDVLETLGGADLVWPLGLTDRLRDALASHIADPQCRRNPTAHFLLPGTGAGLSFTCLAK